MSAVFQPVRCPYLLVNVDIIICCLCIDGAGFHIIKIDICTHLAAVNLCTDAHIIPGKHKHSKGIAAGIRAVGFRSLISRIRGPELPASCFFNLILFSVKFRPGYFLFPTSQIISVRIDTHRFRYRLQCFTVPYKQLHVISADILGHRKHGFCLHGFSCSRSDLLYGNIHQGSISVIQQGSHRKLSRSVCFIFNAY